MAVLGGISFVTGMVFLIAGAWPVFGFFGLDVLLVYWAFRLNYRSARAYEQVTVTPSELTVRKVSHHGRVREWTLNPVWVRLTRDVHEEFGLQRLFLESQGRRVGDRGIPAAVGEGELCAGAVRRAGGSEAWPDTDGGEVTSLPCEAGRD